MAVTSWSHSKIVEFDKCKYRVYLMHDQRIPEPQRELRPGQTEHANDRGTRIHENAELFVKGETDELLPELRSFESEIHFLRVLHDEGMVSLEGEWGLDQNWEPTDWKTAWHRSKLDVIVFWDPTEATVIDYKSGKKFGNEIKHAEQMQLYQLNAFSRYPKLERVTTELWYVDQPDGQNITRQTFLRDQGLRFKQHWHNRGTKLTTNTDWPTNANKFSCKWCMYGPWGSGHCQDGVR